MAKFKEKSISQKLRHKGWSINEIANKIKVSKSTISVWCRNISLTQNQILRLTKKQKLGSHEGRLKGLEKIRQKRINEVETLKKEGIKEIGKLSKRDFFITGIAMYWSEGYNAPVNYEVGFTNSDPKINFLMIDWFKKFCRIDQNRFSLRVGINEAHKKRAKDIEKYWSKLTGVPLSQFNKPSLKKVKSKKFYKNPNSYFGTLRIKIRKGTKLRRKIDGWIEGLAKNHLPG